jgi:hypothetical protein
MAGNESQLPTTLKPYDTVRPGEGLLQALLIGGEAENPRLGPSSADVCPLSEARPIASIK